MSLTGNELVIACYDLEKVSAKCRDKFLKTFENHFKHLQIYTFKSRQKGAKRILDKVLRKRKEGELNNDAHKLNYDPSHVSDAWGCRYVMLFQEDIIEITKEIVKYVKYQEDKYSDLKIHDVDIYTNRPEKDPLSIAEKIKSIFEQALLPEDKINIIPQSRDSGYSSVHIVLETPILVDLPLKGKGPYPFKFEIQIRDIFEEGWSEIAHTLSYAAKDNANDSDNNISDAELQIWRPHLNALKTVTDGCSQHANLIRTNLYLLKAASREARNKSITPLDKDRSRLRETLQKALGPQDESFLIPTIDLAYDLLIEAHEATEEQLDLDAASPFYIAAASKFDEALEVAKKNNTERLEVKVKKVPSEGTISIKDVQYYLRFEKANALMFSLPLSPSDFTVEHRERYEKALKDYQWVVENYPQSAAPRLRLAQAYVKGNREGSDLRKAIEQLDKAAELAPADPEIERDHWIYYEIPVQRAHAYYYLAKHDKNNAKSYLANAISSLEGAVSAEQINAESDTYKLKIFHRIISNTIYFNYILVQDDNDNVDPSLYSEETKQKVAAYLKLLTTLPLSKIAERFVETVDNIIIGALITGNKTLARQKAQVNFSYLEAIANRRASRTGRMADASSGALATLLDARQRKMFRRSCKVIASSLDELAKNIEEDGPRNIFSLSRYFGQIWR